MALSGDRSSCDSVARNSSLAWLAASASARASRSRATASRRSRASSQVRVDAGEQLARRERLDQVVVGAGLEALDARLLAGARREQDHRERRASRGSARSARSRPKPSSPGIITSVRTRSGGARARRLERGARRRRPPRRRSAGRAGGATYSRMSALSSASEDARAAAGVARRRRRPSAAARAGAVVRQPAQRLVDEGAARRRAVEASVRAAPMRSGGRCAGAGRDRDGERGARARRRSRRATRAAVQPDQLLHQREPDAGALVRAAARALRRGGSARRGAAARRPGCPMPVSRTVELDAPSAARAARTAISPSKRELERVREQVEDDLLPHVAVDVDRLGERRAVDDEPSPARSIAERKTLASSAVSAARSVGS